MRFVAFFKTIQLSFYAGRSNQILLLACLCKMWSRNWLQTMGRNYYYLLRGRCNGKRWISSSSSSSSGVGRKRYAAVWGNGDYGRLGLGTLDSQWKPKVLNSSVFNNQSITSISCGGAHTLFLTGLPFHNFSFLFSVLILEFEAVSLSGFYELLLFDRKWACVCHWT